MPQNKRFTVEEIEFIKNNYQVLTVEELAEKFGRTPKAMRGKIERLGLKLSKLSRNDVYTWTSEELQVLKENHLLPDHEINVLLPRFSLSQIVRKRLDLGLRKHTYQPYLQSSYYQRFHEGKRVWVHKEVVEQKIGRKLVKGEMVHHINGCKTDNHPDNLFLCSDRNHHGLVHGQLEQISFELIKQGLIKFDHQTGKYFIPE